MHPHQEQPQPVPAQSVVYVPMPSPQQQAGPQIVSTTQGQWILLVINTIMLLIVLGLTIYVFGVVHAAANPFG